MQASKNGKVFLFVLLMNLQILDMEKKKPGKIHTRMWNQMANLIS